MNRVLASTKLPLPNFLQEVPIFTTYAGDDGEFRRYSVEHGAKGIVMQELGTGNVNQNVFQTIRYALNKKVPIVIASRVRYGGVYVLYGDEGGGNSLIDIGHIGLVI